MYKTLVYFEDLKDKRRPYMPGDTYPRQGLKVSKERLEELSTDKNKRGIPLIVEVEPEETPEEKPEEKPEKEEKPKKKK